ncbi:MAG: hypothetical protein KAR42_14810 [candidate division Zixibacteria bacterium]|nr:hypothetical protein [candidate division Zixibacteria bacterium]
MQKGKQFLDLRGDFILTHNDALVKTRNKSAAPVKVNNADYTCVKSLNFVKRIVITVKVIAFIWGSNEALVPEKTGLNTPHVNDDEQPKDYVAECDYFHIDKHFCLHPNNLDNSCIGRNTCPDYLTGNLTPSCEPFKPVK